MAGPGQAFNVPADRMFVYHSSHCAASPNAARSGTQSTGQFSMSGDRAAAASRRNMSSSSVIPGRRERQSRMRRRRGYAGDDPSADAGLAGEISGVDCAQPLSPDDVAAIEAGMDRYAVLVFREQNLTDAQQIAFTRHFGELESYQFAGPRPQSRRTSAARPRDRRFLEPRQGRRTSSRPTSGYGSSSSATGCGIPTARSGLMPAEIFAAVGAGAAEAKSLGGRQYRVRRHARRL